MIELEQLVVGVFGIETSYDNQLVRCDGANTRKIQVCPDIYCDDDGQLSVGGSSASAMLDITQRAAGVTALKITGSADRSSPLLQLVEGSGTPTGDLIQISDKIYVDVNGQLGVNESDPETLIEATHTAPYMTFHNSTEEDTAGGRESKLLFKGEQSGGEETTLASITVAHDGSSDDQKGYIAFATNDGSDNDAPTEIMRILSSGRVGIGVTNPDDVLEVNGTIRVANDHFRILTQSNINFIQSGDASTNSWRPLYFAQYRSLNTYMVLDSSGNMGLGYNNKSPNANLHQLIYAAGTIGHIIELAASPTANAFEVNTNGGSGGDLIKFTSGGKIQTTSGFRGVANQWGDAYIGWEYGGDTAEHSGQTGSYDHTGGTYDRLFTATAGVFTQDDEDNHNWIVINSGTYKGAKAEIETYVDSTNAIVRGMGWDGDISSSTFSIVPHPLFIAGDGKNIHFGVGSYGVFGIHSQGFTGTGDCNCISNICADFGKDDAHAMCIDIHGNGYNHIDGLQINSIVGDLQPGDIAHMLHITIDDTDATSADSTTDIDAISVETTDISSSAKHAIHVGVGFDLAFYVSGAASEDPDYGYEVSSGSVVDRVNSGGAGDDAFVNAAVDQQIFDADNDYILIGSDATFEVIGVNLATPANQPCELEFYYSKAGGGWTQFYPSDTTAGFTRSGAISFTAPGDWTQDDEAEANGDITNAYYVKIMRTRNNLVTPPTESYFKIYASLEAGMQIRGDGTVKPAHLADADAANDSWYYSTDQSKLCYKDSVGAVNDLY